MKISQAFQHQNELPVVTNFFEFTDFFPVPENVLTFNSDLSGGNFLCKGELTAFITVPIATKDQKNKKVTFSLKLRSVFTCNEETAEFMKRNESVTKPITPGAITLVMQYNGFRFIELFHPFLSADPENYKNPGPFSHLRDDLGYWEKEVLPKINGRCTVSVRYANVVSEPRTVLVFAPVKKRTRASLEEEVEEEEEDEEEEESRACKKTHFVRVENRRFSGLFEEMAEEFRITRLVDEAVDDVLATMEGGNTEENLMILGNTGVAYWNYN